MQIRHIGVLATQFHTDPTTPANLDCLVNKFHCRFIRTLFIKLRLILCQWPDVVVNRALLWRGGPCERRIKLRKSILQRSQVQRARA